MNKTLFKEKIKVVIVEDNRPLLQFFRNSIRSDSRLLECGVAECFSDGLKRVRESSPDVLLTDIGLPDGSGVDLIREFKHLCPKGDALVITVFGDDATILAAIRAGASGYILKDGSGEDVAKTIVEVREGAAPITPMIAHRILAMLRKEPDLARVLVGTMEERIHLSPKENEVLSLISRGFTYQEIATLSKVSMHTVQFHIKNLYGKLSVHSRSEAVFEASKLGLLPPL